MTPRCSLRSATISHLLESQQNTDTQCLFLADDDDDVAHDFYRALRFRCMISPITMAFITTHEEKADKPVAASGAGAKIPGSIRQRLSFADSPADQVAS